MARSVKSDPPEATEPVEEAEVIAPAEEAAAAPEEVAPETPETTEAPEQAPEPPQTARRGNPFWPILGGLIAAVIGYGVAQLVPGGWPVSQDTALKTEVAKLSQEVDTLSAEVSRLSDRPVADPGLAGRVAALEARPAPPDLSAQQTKLADEVGALSDKLDKLATTVAATPAPGTGPDAAALKSLQDQVAALSAAPVKVPAEIESAVAAAKTQLDSATADAKAAVAAAKTQLAAANAEAEARAQHLTEMSAWRELSSALDSGAPYASAVAALSGQDLPAVLNDNARSGLPTLQSLRDSFPAAARAALDAARRADMGASWTARITAFLETQTGARSLTPRAGNDPDAILSRAEADLGTGDLAAALREVASLPDAAKPAMADWLARAKLRQDAADAVAALGKTLGQ